jgi:hypothetical protein
MPDRITVNILGLLHGTAEGHLAIGVLFVIVLVVSRRLWWLRRCSRLTGQAPEGREPICRTNVRDRARLPAPPRLPRLPRGVRDRRR